VLQHCGRAAYMALIHPRSDDPMLSSNLNEAWENRQFLLLSNCKDVVTCATEVRRIAREHQQVPTEARRLPTLNQDIEAVLFHLNKSPFNSSPLPSGYTILQFFQRKLLKDKTAGRPPIGPSGRWADLTAFSTAVAVEVVLLAKHSPSAFSAYEANPALEGKPSRRGDDDKRSRPCVVCGKKCGATKASECTKSCGDCGLNYCRHTWDKSFPCMVKNPKTPDVADATNALEVNGKHKRIPAFLFAKIKKKHEALHNGDANPTEQETADAEAIRLSRYSLITLFAYHAILSYGYRYSYHSPTDISPWTFTHRSQLSPAHTLFCELRRVLSRHFTTHLLSSGGASVC
jgi:hypothetical protein